MVRTLLAALFVGCPLLVASACLAATIEPVKGNLSINHGQGFEKVNGRVSAGVGDAVMVSPNGSAVVAYPDGCKVNVEPGAVITIAPISPCASGSFAQDQSHSPQLGTYIVGAGVLGVLGSIGYEISQTTTTPPRPASP